MKDVATLNQVPTFADIDIFHVVVESPRGSTTKLKYRADLDAMSISRPLAIGVVYPYDWGFVPSTTGEDGDPVDAALFWDVATFPGVVVPCRALGLIQVEQNRADGQGRARNDRILALPIHARREGRVDLSDVASHARSRGTRALLHGGDGPRRQGRKDPWLGRS